MQKRNTNKQLLFKLTQLEQLLRGMDFKSFKFLEDALKLSQRTIQRRIIELNNPKGKVQERFNPINKKDKEFRIFDPANNSLPLFSQDEIFEIWDKVVYKGQIDINRNILDKLLKIISIRTSDTGPYKDKYHKIEKAISNLRKIEFEYKQSIYNYTIKSNGNTTSKELKLIKRINIEFPQKLTLEDHKSPSSTSTIILMQGLFRSLNSTSLLSIFTRGNKFIFCRRELIIIII